MVPFKDIQGQSLVFLSRPGTTDTHSGELILARIVTFAGFYKCAQDAGCRLGNEVST